NATPVVFLDQASLAAENCAPTNNAIDPGETVTLNFQLGNQGTASTTNLMVTLLATNGVIPLDGPQSYGAITAAGTDVVRSFTFLASGPCGGSVSPILHLQDGETDLGFLSRSFGLGALVPASTIVTNPTYLAIPGSGSVGPGSPYPSSITISNVNGP